MAIGLAIGIPLLVRARRRTAWNAELAAAEDDVAWFARVLVPQLRQSSSVEEVGGGWTVGAARVAAAEDRLTGLEPTAPDEASRTRALSLRDAVRDARGTVQGLVDGGMTSDISPTLDQVVARLEAALAPPIAEV